ncbi:formamidopyrimidine-DNA glycosylase [Agrilactobacillus composti DSM 18527 = JCM 14202]|uniref:Formamidopyrimidine-DNA glycosylase n=1 Tax=Agrilactobacillus composti DSM 18527 = JCM 14202 TaxID=1423734 RepID=X0PE89_9LACO|nr:DNA-formamidopyrimidine glycosylase [Agrilactobacillus composti]KRM35775.1 formamidopyrimidine-DNA glycosylase [Agrilactobacillus composti DSM 18527 = JCM 14202]GAF39638.1 formamidopyrimidine-DNA glycosylase [Agrilactobacillus composti DSM 18527 = JCM 14202]
MPELPEVETVRKGLLALVQDKKIATVDVYWSKIITNDTAKFQKALQGKVIKTIDRRGKYLLFRFSDNLTMVSHLRMEGKYHLDTAATPIDKHTHVVFNFTDGTQLRYADVRKFGRMTLGLTGFEQSLSGIAALGPEPLSKAFTITGFTQALKKHHKNIKAVLLDQHTVAGLGNIYCDEVLWLCKIHPLQPADTLTADEIKALHAAIQTELRTAIAAGGTTIRSYVDASGQQGHFQLQLHVYGREGQPCERCGTIIEKFKVAGRGTHICPKEQQLR